MIANPPTLIVPIRMDEHGAIRVSNTRVTLDTLLARYQQGDSPESIHDGFPTVPLTDIYAIIAYYLVHRDEVDAYLKQRDEEAQRIRQEVEANATPEQRARTQALKALLAQKRQEQNR
jgi:uncharacterized protein (DUF433 family)